MDENNVIGDDGLEYVDDDGLEYVEEEEYYEDDEGETGLEVVEDDGIESVSYTHLTLPTTSRVLI